MRRAGRLVGMTLARLMAAIHPGMATAELESIAQAEIARHGAAASFKGYRGFPAALCVSVNDEIVHGIPGSRVLREGDIVSMDLGIKVDGFHGDSAVTVAVGKIAPETETLIRVTREALMVGIDAARDGAYLGDVSAAIQSEVEATRFAVVREYVGHGIGRDVHEEPQIPNFGVAGTGPMLRKGMTMALEPMVNMGDWPTKVDGDNWTVRTADGSLSAHWEHTIAITKGRAEILTRR